MSKQLQNFKKYGFRVCCKESCTRKEECLRYYVWKNYTENENTIICINPLFDGLKDECQFFRQIQPIKLAYGFDKSMYDELPKKKSERLWNKIHNYFGNAEYYRYLRGEKPLFPDQQQFLEQEFRKTGYQGEFLYLKVEEDYDLNDVISEEDND